MAGIAITNLQLLNTMASKYSKQKGMGENTDTYHQHQALYLCNQQIK